MVRLVLRFTFSIFFFIIATSSSFGQSDFFENADAFLKKHIKFDRVDYKNVIQDSASRKQLIEDMEDFPVVEKDPDTQKAFWINAYIIIAIETVTKTLSDRFPFGYSGLLQKEKQSCCR